jgi:hypothetical protein
MIHSAHACVDNGIKTWREFILRAMSERICSYPGGCDREGIRLFNAPPVDGWLCEEHFQETLNAAAEVEADARRKADAEWQLHLEKYLRERNLTLQELTEEHARAALDSWGRRRPAPS